MKNIIFSIILLMISFSVNAQTELQPLKVGNVTISFDKTFGEQTGFSIIVKTTIDNVTKTSLYRSVIEAIAPIQRECGRILTPNQMLYLYRLADEEAPAWLLKAAKVVPL